MFKHSKFYRIFAALILIVFSTLAFAQDSITFNRVYNHPYSGQTWGVTPRGNYLYVGTSSAGFHTFDITNPASPTETGSIPYSSVGDVAYVWDLGGNFAAVKTINNYLVLLNLSDPAHPTYVGNLNTAGYVHQVVKVDSLIYLAESIGIQVFSVAHPNAPTLISTVSSTAELTCMAVEGNRLYAGRSGGIAVYDITSRTSPALLGSIAGSSLAFRLAVNDGIVYLANYYNGLKVYNATNPANISLVYTWTRPSGSPSNSASQDICLAGSTLFLADGWNGIVAFDVSNPMQPVVSGRNACVPVGLYYRDNYLYSAEYGNGFAIYHVDGMTPPPPSDSVTFNRVYNHLYTGQTWGATPRGNYLYVGTSFSGFRTFDITNPAAPTETGAITTTGDWLSYMTDIGGNYAVVMTTSNYLRLINLADPAHPADVGTVATAGFVDQVLKVDSIMYVAERGLGFQVYSIAHPNAPVLLSSVTSSGGLSGLAVEGNRLYVGKWSGGISIYDITTLTTPMFIGTVAGSGLARRLVVRDGIVYVASSETGVTIYDANDTTNVHILSTWQRPAGASANASSIDVYLNGNTLFLADGWNGLFAINVANPSQPRITGRYANSVPVEVTYRNNYLYVAEYGNGFAIYQIGGTVPPPPPPPPPPSDSLTFARVFNQTYPGLTWGATLRGNYLYAGTFTSGFHTWNIANPNAPTETNSITLPGGSSYLTDIGGNYGVVMGASGQLNLVNLADPAHPTFVNTIATLSVVDQVIKVDSVMYVAERYQGLHIYSVAHPNAPVLVANVTTPGLYGVAYENNRLYTGQANGGVSVYDVTNRTSPVLLGSIAGTDLARRLAVRNGIVYVACNSIGVKIYDATTPANIHLISSWVRPFGSPENSASLDLCLTGNNLFIADGWNGLFSLNVTNPSQPIENGRYANSVPVELTYRDNYLYVAEYGNGFSIYHVSGVTPPPPPPQPPLQLVYPNGGERIHLGSADTIRWVTSGLIPAVAIKINYNYPNGDWETIAGYAPNTGSYVWIATGPVTEHARIKVVNVNSPDVLTVSAGDFTLYSNGGLSVSDRLVPSHSGISYAYPNPFNTSTTINFSLPTTENSKLEVFNSNGQLVEMLASGRLAAGNHSINWNARRNNSGVYFYRLTAGNKVETKRIILVK